MLLFVVFPSLHLPWGLDVHVLLTPIYTLVYWYRMLIKRREEVTREKKKTNISAKACTTTLRYEQKKKKKKRRTRPITALNLLIAAKRSGLIIYECICTYLVGADALVHGVLRATTTKQKILELTKTNRSFFPFLFKTTNQHTNTVETKKEYTFVLAAVKVFKQGTGSPCRSA